MARCASCATPEFLSSPGSRRVISAVVAAISRNSDQAWDNHGYCALGLNFLAHLTAHASAAAWFKEGGGRTCGRESWGR